MLSTAFVAKTPPLPCGPQVAGLGLAKPFLNGRRVADHAMGPQSQLFTRVMYTTFDVTAHVAAGSNALGMMVGTGKYGYLGAWCQKDSAVECTAFRSLLHVWHADGSEELIGRWQPKTTNNKHPPTHTHPHTP